MKVKSLSCVRLVTLWTVTYQAPPSMGFSRQEYWSGLPFPSPGDLPDPGIEPGSPALQANTLTSEPPSFPFYCFPLFLGTDHWGRLSYLSLLFFGPLHSNGFILPFLLCLLLLTFSQLFVVLLRQLFCLFAFLFLGDGLDHCLLYNVTNHHP